MLTVYPKKYAHGFVVLCFVVVMQLFRMNSHEVFIHIHQGWFAGTGAIVRLPQCQWSKPDGYGKISQCITTTKHSKAKTVCIFLGIYCRSSSIYDMGQVYLRYESLAIRTFEPCSTFVMKYYIIWYHIWQLHIECLYCTQCCVPYTRHITEQGRHWLPNSWKFAITKKISMSFFIVRNFHKP